MAQLVSTASRAKASSQYGKSARRRRVRSDIEAERPRPTRSRAPNLLVRSVVFEEPLAVQRIERAVRLHAGEGRIDRCHQVGAGLEDEAELVRTNRIADRLEHAWIGGEVTLYRSLVHQHHVDVAGLERLHRGAESVEQLDAAVVRLVAVLEVGIEQILGGIKARGARLRADQQVGIGDEVARLRDALFV